MHSGISFKRIMKRKEQNAQINTNILQGETDMKKYKQTEYELQEAGLDTKWVKSTIRPKMICLCAREPKTDDPNWYKVTPSMWRSAESLEGGIKEAFVNHTILGDIFSIPV